MRPSGKLDPGDVPEDPPEDDENEQQFDQQTAVHLFIEPWMGVFDDGCCDEKDKEGYADDYHRIIEECILDIEMKQGVDSPL